MKTRGKLTESRRWCNRCRSNTGRCKQGKENNSRATPLMRVSQLRITINSKKYNKRLNNTSREVLIWEITWIEEEWLEVLHSKTRKFQGSQMYLSFKCNSKIEEQMLRCKRHLNNNQLCRIHLKCNLMWLKIHQSHKHQRNPTSRHQCLQSHQRYSHQWHKLQLTQVFLLLHRADKMVKTWIQISWKDLLHKIQEYQPIWEMLRTLLKTKWWDNKWCSKWQLQDLPEEGLIHRLWWCEWCKQEEDLLIQVNLAWI